MSQDENYVPEHAAEVEPIVGDAPPQANVLLSNRSYEVLKWVAQILLPALGALYFGMSQLLGLPYGVEVVGTIALIDTFLGAVLGFSSRQYNNSPAAFDGQVLLTPDHENELTNLNVRIDPAALETGQKQLRLRVKHQ